MNSLYDKFIDSGDTLWVCNGGKTVFTSKKGTLFPLLDYINDSSSQRKQMTIFDKVMGNAAALLSVKALASEVWSPLGSQYAIDTLNKYKIKSSINKIVPFIRNRDGTDMCPMEKLSISKDMNPDKFYENLLKRQAEVKQQ